MPDKVAELTKLHDAWLTEMANPVKAGTKRFGMTTTDGTDPMKKKKKTKKPKE
jgi:hypothetical protein